MSHQHDLPPEPPPAQILRDAAQYLQRHGWTQGQFYDHPQNPRPFPYACALGAIGIATHGESIDNPAADESCQPAATVLLTYILTCYDGDFDTVEEWNDHPGCTAAQVIATLNAAAIEAENNSR